QQLRPGLWRAGPGLGRSRRCVDCADAELDTHRPCFP
ncbi:hypothetical protein BN1723_019534, partial [Verticillium longisporum]